MQEKKLERSSGSNRAQAALGQDLVKRNIVRLIRHTLDFLAIKGHANQKWLQSALRETGQRAVVMARTVAKPMPALDRKSTRLNSSHT